MAGPLKLNEYYKGVLELAAVHLLNKHKAEEVPTPYEKNSKYVKFYQLERVIEGKRLTLILCLPFNYPDDLPKVFIPEPLFSELFPIPHLDCFNTLCTFDENEVHPNEEQPIEILEQVIERAFYLLHQGYTHQNDTDFVDELKSYWDQETKYLILSLINPDSLPREVYWIHFQKSGHETFSLIADSKEDGEKWVSQYGGNILGMAVKAWYQPVTSLGMPPFPTKNREMYQRLSKHGNISIRPFLSFLNRNNRPSLIVFSIPHIDGYVMGAWLHSKNEQILKTAYKGKGRLQTSLKGFRAGKRNAHFELSRDFGNLPIIRYRIERVDAKRLFTRGGDGPSHKDSGIAMIGCGSIGSHLSQALVESGTQKMLLIDSEKLNFENIARHSCGATYVGEPKVHAIKHSLVSHFPQLDITVRNQDVLQTIIKQEDLLNTFDLVISALGAFAVEHRLNLLLRDGKISTPMLFVWVEPFAVGGHAIYVDPKRIGCFDCLFDSLGRYQRGILRHPDRYLKREAGCQTSYTPYSVVDLKRFIYDLNVFIDEIMKGEVRKNTVFTWIGNLKAHQEQGREIAGRWKASQPYSSWRLPIEEFGLCDRCDP
ncbi:hypothetical protein GNQ08_07650 [Paenibacillus macerans]|uniref:Uncharacterized protein n=3 Tax=Paenibacillus macerans TaxID=44252 RepID=A0A6N8EU65_PAEMA|nr:ThiF family adenylyltransferase [Paenibacillus macerans]MUG22290.1 hypothetical protein [Paenibacillus macerans]GBK65871.1 hypothetical protein PbDSM24746_58750 [Paenibacillus macerans]GBK72201.1 hypothetical protein PbJCM17693_59090 [Paenibacillus macerans]